MAYRRYYSPFENSVRVDPPRVTPPAPPPVRRQVKKFKAPRIPTLTYPIKSGKGFFEGIQADDLIIIGLIMLLLFEEREERDMPLIVGLGALLLSGFWDT